MQCISLWDKRPERFRHEWAGIWQKTPERNLYDARMKKEVKITSNKARTLMSTTLSWVVMLAMLLVSTPTMAQQQYSVEKSAASYYARCREFQTKGDFDRAISDYNIALTFEPHFVNAYYCRARTHISKGDLDAALNDLNRALELKPDLSVAYNDRG